MASFLKNEDQTDIQYEKNSFILAYRCRIHRFLRFEKEIRPTTE
jgi:hypothetical protein